MHKGSLFPVRRTDFILNLIHISNMNNERTIALLSEHYSSAASSVIPVSQVIADASYTSVYV